MILLATSLAACGDAARGDETAILAGTSAPATTDPTGALSFPLTSSTSGPEGSSTAAATATSGGSSTGVEDPAIDHGDPERTIRFAAIGDFGSDLVPEAQVAELVRARAPDFVITLGDNNYFDGEERTIDRNIGKYYHAFIGHYAGAYGPGSPEARFFPAPGNHDWNTGTLDPYLAYFTLPGNERYYEFRRGPVHFFVLDSDTHEPDGATADSAQATWLEQALAASEAPFKLVYFHHPPYSSGYHLGTAAMRWPFREWGADLVLAGHDHNYERLLVDDLLYIVNGCGGAALRDFNAEEVGARRGTPEVYGALFVTADPAAMTLDFVTPRGDLVDRVTLLADPPADWQPLVPLGSTWRYRQDDPGPDWRELAVDDTGWPEGQAPLGVGIGGEATQIPPNRVTFLRHTFTADAAGGPLRLRLAVDDGALVYLNGAEIYRANMPSGPVHPETFAATAVGWWYEDKLADTIVPGDALVVGDNVLAVELHQHSVTSADLRLDLELARPL